MLILPIDQTTAVSGGDSDAAGSTYSGTLPASIELGPYLDMLMSLNHSKQ